MRSSSVHPHSESQVKGHPHRQVNTDLTLACAVPEELPGLGLWPPQLSPAACSDHQMWRWRMSSMRGGERAGSPPWGSCPCPTWGCSMSQDCVVWRPCSMWYYPVVSKAAGNRVLALTQSWLSLVPSSCWCYKFRSSITEEPAEVHGQRLFLQVSHGK